MKTRTRIKVTDTLRLIIINLGHLTLACRIEAVYKVVNHSQIHSSGLGYTGLTTIDGQTVIVIDLHRKLFKSPLADEPEYFVIIKSQRSELLAIPVTESPNLMDVQREDIRVLPDAYRQSDTLAIANQIAIVPYKDKTLTIFVLDEHALI
jgi:purine-binding chemotaxis protein CheW